MRSLKGITGTGIRKAASVLTAVVVFLSASWALDAQNDIKVEAPNMVGLDEQFNVTFIIEGDDSPSDFQWSAGNDFQLVWGPQKGTSTSIQILNGKRTRSSQHTYTYILAPKSAGTFQLPAATAKVKGNAISSRTATIEVVTNGSSSSSRGSSSGSSSGGGSSQSQPSTSSTGEVSSEDLFMRLSLSKTSAVIGEPITATLKLYQRVNLAGFEDAKFPSFNGFWSQETEAPSNIEFQRESFDDKIYNTAVLRRYVIIPQQAGSLQIDPSELVVLVNVRTPSRGTGSIFDSFFEDDYRTIRKRISTPAITVNVKSLPSGAPSSFGGGVGKFSISAKMSKDSLKTHEAVSLMVTVSGKGNVSLLEAPKVSFPPDMEVYDTKVTENTDRGTGGTSGSKSFEYPFIPRSHGEFTIEPIEYSYYDTSSGQYVTVKTDPITFRVARGQGDSAASTGGSTLQVTDRKGVRNLGEDIRYIRTKAPSLEGGSSFFVGKPLFWILASLLLAAFLGLWTGLRSAAARRADVVSSKNRRATKMALSRLKTAGDFLSKNLYTAFYEELHRALLGFMSDKLNISGEALSRDNMSSSLLSGGVPQETVDQFISLLDACEYARYAPSEGNEAMKAHYDSAVDVISKIDSSMKGHSSSRKTAAGAVSAILLLVLPFAADAQDSYPDSLWNRGVTAYEAGLWTDAASSFEAIAATGIESADVYYNAGNAYFKAGDYPKAILNYERALKVDPSHKDARFNLEFASSQVQDKIDSVPEFFLRGWMRNLCYTMGSNSWAVLSLLLLALTLALALLFILGSSAGKRRLGFFTGIAAFLLFVLTLSMAIWQKKDFEKADDAIVMVPVSSVKSSPSSEGAKDLFVLHEGTKVKVLDEVGSWRNIQLSDGREGWMKSSDMEVI